MYLNINSIVSNINELEKLLGDESPEIVLYSETCATKEIMDSEMDIDTYKMIRCA